MQVGLEQAQIVFESFDGSLQAPSLHPFYIEADARRDALLEAIFFTYLEGEKKYYHGFHLAQIPGTSYFDIQSAYGYGGPIASCLDAGFHGRVQTDFEKWCKERKVIAEFIRFHPVLKNWQFFAGTVMDDRETVSLDLTQADLLRSYGTRVRTAVRKAQKSGLTVEWIQSDAYVGMFGELYRQVMAGLDASEFYFFQDNYLKTLLNWNKAYLAVCKQNEEVAGGGIFLVGSEVMEYHLSAANDLGKKLGATNLILHSAALLGQELGCKVLHLGGGSESSPDNPLLFFKSGFSPQRALFRIGKLIHDHAAYENLKEEYKKEHGQVPQRVLFYRF